MPFDLQELKDFPQKPIKQRICRTLKKVAPSPKLRKRLWAQVLEKFGENGISFLTSTDIVNVWKDMAKESGIQSTDLPMSDEEDEVLDNDEDSVLSLEVKKLDNQEDAGNGVSAGDGNAEDGSNANNGRPSARKKRKAVIPRKASSGAIKRSRSDSFVPTSSSGSLTDPNIDAVTGSNSQDTKNMKFTLPTPSSHSSLCPSPNPSTHMFRPLVNPSELMHKPPSRRSSTPHLSLSTSSSMSSLPLPNLHLPPSELHNTQNINASSAYNLPSLAPTVFHIPSHPAQTPYDYTYHGAASAYEAFRQYNDTYPSSSSSSNNNTNNEHTLQPFLQRSQSLPTEPRYVPLDASNSAQHQILPPFSSYEENEQDQMRSIRQNSSMPTSNEYSQNQIDYSAFSSSSSGANSVTSNTPHLTTLSVPFHPYSQLVEGGDSFGSLNSLASLEDGYGSFSANTMQNQQSSTGPTDHQQFFSFGFHAGNNPNKTTDSTNTNSDNSNNANHQQQTFQFFSQFSHPAVSAANSSSNPGNQFEHDQFHSYATPTSVSNSALNGSATGNGTENTTQNFGDNLNIGVYGYPPYSFFHDTEINVESNEQGSNGGAADKGRQTNNEFGYDYLL
ncbi:hypothetical protein BKA69DRAFT_1055584, partial [Paraphysoderma sedebokerense]